MPTLNLDQFESPPSVGDKVTVKGEIESIDTATGEVEVTYDSVTVKSSNEDGRKEETLDEAIDKAFPNRRESNMSTEKENSVE